MTTILTIAELYPDFEHHLIQACNFSTSSSTLTQSMQYSLQAGGKRIRPLLALTTCQELGCNVEKAYPIALALECIHTYSLIHDDLPCMDDDDLRRGKPSNHIIYGQAHATLSGDALNTLAFDILSDTNTNLDPNTCLQVIAEIAKAAGYKGMVGGQALDLENENKSVSLSILESIHRHKTGKLIEASVVSGALVATIDANTISTLRTFGQAIGLAFQIADDILDVTQNSQTLGKNAGRLSSASRRLL